MVLVFKKEMYAQLKKKKTFHGLILGNKHGKKENIEWSQCLRESFKLVNYYQNIFDQSETVK